MDAIQTMVKNKYENQIMQELQNFLNSAEGKLLIRRKVKEEVKCFLREATLDELFNDDGQRFYRAIDKALSERFKI